MNFKISSPRQELQILAGCDKISAVVGSNLTGRTMFSTLEYPVAPWLFPTPLGRAINASDGRDARPSKSRLQHDVSLLYERHIALPLAIRPTAEFLAMEVAITHPTNALDN